MQPRSGNGTSVMSQKHRPDLVTRSIDGEIVIFDQSAGNVHHLNATASHIWGQCDGTQSAADIAARVAATFNGVPETVLEDVLATLADFRRLGLLVDSDPVVGSMAVQE
jgi:hypothetical protein